MQTAKGIPEKEKIQCGESRTCHHDLWLTPIMRRKVSAYSV